MADEIKHVFISHLHEDDEGLGNLKDLLAKSGMNVKDASIDSTSPNEAKSPEYIKSKILAPQIQWAGTFIVYISPKTKDSEWVDWEIKYALSQGKKIVGVWAHGSNECDLPDALEKYANAVIVGWHGQSIIDAINGKNEDWERPDGGRSPRRAIEPHPC